MSACARDRRARDGARFASCRSSSPECDAIDENGLTFEIEIPSHDAWTVDIDVSIAVLGQQSADVPALAWATRPTRPNLRQNLDRWIAGAPRLKSDWELLNQA